MFLRLGQGREGMFRSAGRQNSWPFCRAALSWRSEQFGAHTLLAAPPTRIALTREERESAQKKFALAQQLVVCYFKTLTHHRVCAPPPPSLGHRFSVRFPVQTPEKAEKYKLAELKNGRLAMMGVSGALTQMAMTGHGFPFLG